MIRPCARQPAPCMISSERSNPKSRTWSISQHCQPQASLSSRIRPRSVWRRKAATSTSELAATSTSSFRRLQLLPGKRICLPATPFLARSSLSHPFSSDPYSLPNQTKSAPPPPHPLLLLLLSSKTYWCLVLRSWLCTALATLALLSFVPRVGELSALLGQGQLGEVVRGSAGVLALVAVRSVCTYLQDAWLWECAINVATDMRQRAFETILQQDMGFFELQQQGQQNQDREQPKTADVGSLTNSDNDSLDQEPSQAGKKKKAAEKEHQEASGGSALALGDILFRLTVETRECGDVLFALLKALVPAVLQTLAMAFRMVSLSGTLTVATFCVLPAMAAVIALMGERVRGISGNAQRTMAALTNYVSEVLPGMLVVKTHLTGQFEAERFARLAEEDGCSRIRKKQAKALFPEAITAAYTVAVVVLFVVSTWVVGRGRLTSAGIVSFFSSLVLLVEPIQAAGSAYNEAKQGQPAVERVLQLLSLGGQRNPPGTPQQPVPEKVNGTAVQTERQAPLKQRTSMVSYPTPKRRLDGFATANESAMLDVPWSKSPLGSASITFDRVSFSYNHSGHASSRDRGLALDNVSFRVASGESVAIVGASGSGKSTLLKLLLRLYRPTEGAILLGDQNISSVDDDTWRETIGVVPQESILFSGSIISNIAYGHHLLSQHDERSVQQGQLPNGGFTSCTDSNTGRGGRESDALLMQRVVDAAKLADAHNFVMQFPEGYWTDVGRGGCNLSGGQRQRIAIARALFHDPAILVLDEPTSSLDNLSGRAVREALKRLMADRTVVLVDHKLEAIQEVDRIICLKEGKVVEDGRLEEIMAFEHGCVRRLFEPSLPVLT